MSATRVSHCSWPRSTSRPDMAAANAFDSDASRNTVSPETCSCVGRVGETDAAFEQHLVVLDDGGGRAPETSFDASTPSSQRSNFVRDGGRVARHGFRIDHRNRDQRQRRRQACVHDELFAAGGAALGAASGDALLCRSLRRGRDFLACRRRRCRMLRTRAGWRALGRFRFFCVIRGEGGGGGSYGKGRKQGNQKHVRYCSMRSPGPVMTLVLCSKTRRF